MSRQRKEHINLIVLLNQKFLRIRREKKEQIKCDLYPKKLIDSEFHVQLNVRVLFEDEY